MADNETPVEKGAEPDKKASAKKKVAKKKATPRKKASPIKKAAPKKKSVPKKKTAPKKKPTPKKAPVPKRQAEKEVAAEAATKQAETHKVSPDKTQQAPVAESKEGVIPPPTSTDSRKKKRMPLWPWAMLLALGGAAVYLLNNPQKIGNQATDQNPAPAVAKKDAQAIAPSPAPSADESTALATENTDTTTQTEAEQISPTQDPGTIQSESTESLVITSTQAPDATISEGVIPHPEDAKPAETSETIDMKSPPTPGAETNSNPQLAISNLESESRETSPGAAATAIGPSTDEKSVTAVESKPDEEPVGTGPISPEDQAQEPVDPSPERHTGDAPVTEPKTKVKSTQKPSSLPSEQVSTTSPAFTDQGAASGEVKPIIAEDTPDSGVTKTTSPQAVEKPSPKSAARGMMQSPKYLERPANAWTHHGQARRQYRTPYHYRPYYYHGGYYPYGYYYGRRAPYTVYNPYLHHGHIPKDKD